MLSLPLLLAIVAIALVGAFWQNSLGARERANRAAQEACERLRLQFLDGTVAFARIVVARVAGRLTLRRTYVFDYSAASVERRQGFVVLVGQRVESIGFEPNGHSPHQAETHLPHHADAPAKASARHPDNLLNLDEWRKRHPSKRAPAMTKPPNNSGDQGW
jgi:hypothetical protein